MTIMKRFSMFFLIILSFTYCRRADSIMEKQILVTARNQLLRAEQLMIQQTGEAALVIDSIFTTAKQLENDSLYAAALKAMGEYSIYMGEFERFDSCMNAVLITDFKNSEMMHAETYTALAEQNNYTGNYEEAIRQTELAHHLLKKVKDPDSKLIQLVEFKLALIKGLSYFWLSKNDSMQVYMDQALEFAKEMRVESNILFVYSYLGYMYYQLSDFHKAEENLIKAADIARKSNNYEALSSTLISLAGNSIGLKKYDDAIKQCTEALQIEKEHMQMEGKLTYIFNNRAEAYHKTGEHDLAIKDALDALKYGDQIKDTSQLIIAYSLLSGAYCSSGDLKNSLPNAEKALELLNRSQSDWNLKERVYKLLSNIYKQTEDHFNALKYSELTNEARDSIQSAERHSALHELEIKYETTKKEQELIIARQAIRTHKIVHFSLAAIISIFIVAIAIFHRFKRKQRITELELLKQSESALQSKLQLINQYKPEPVTIPATAETNGNDGGETETTGNETETPDLNGRNGTILSTERVDNIAREVLMQFKEQKIYLDKSITLKKLADMIGTNTTYLSNVLNQALGTNFSNMLNLYRIEEAKNILKKQVEGQCNIINLDVIAEQCGFNSASAFHVDFKKETGMTPGQYKKWIQKMGSVE